MDQLREIESEGCLLDLRYCIRQIGQVPLRVPITFRDVNPGPPESNHGREIKAALVRWRAKGSRKTRMRLEFVGGSHINFDMRLTPNDFKYACNIHTEKDVNVVDRRHIEPNEL